jgi:hypothetical protein
MLLKQALFYIRMGCPIVESGGETRVGKKLGIEALPGSAPRE